MKVWSVDKRAATGTDGIVAAQHWKASRAGARVLAAGGNAVDAAVTAGLVLSVVEPWLSGLGGGGFLVRVDGRDGGRAETLDFNMASPMALDPGRYPLVAGRDGDWFDWPAVEDDRNLIGPEAIGVPGAVAGFAAALERHGTIGFGDAARPALEEARLGLEIDWFAALCIGIDAAGLARDPGSAAWLLPAGAPPRPAERGAMPRLSMPAAVRTLEALIERGPEDFYTGTIARELVGDLSTTGCTLSAADLANYAPRWDTTLCGDYRGDSVHVMSGASGGPALLDMLARLAADPDYAGGVTPEAGDFDCCARAIRAAYEHRLKQAGHAGAGADCTTHVSVIDADGVAVSMTNTLLSRFGAKVTSPRTGILMNNAMMWFDPRPAQPNSIAAGTRPLANMCPVVVVRDGHPVLALGAAGGRQIFPAVGQILSFVRDFGMDLETALHTPRIDASAPTVRVDRRAPSATAGLIGAHRPVELVDDDLYPVRFAIPSAVARRGDGTLEGMSHPNHPWAAAVAADDVEH